MTQEQIASKIMEIDFEKFIDLLIKENNYYNVMITNSDVKDFYFTNFKIMKTLEQLGFEGNVDEVICVNRIVFIGYN